MSTQNHINQNDPGAPQPADRLGAKKPYRRPAFRHERVFETRALVCGKINGTQGACASNRKTSCRCWGLMTTAACGQRPRLQLEDLREAAQRAVLAGVARKVGENRLIAMGECNKPA